MASNSFGLFIQQLNSADDVLKVKVCQIIFDLFLAHDIDTLVSKTMVVRQLFWISIVTGLTKCKQPDKVVELIRHTLSLDIAEVQAVACEGVAKLMLAGMISDEVVSSLCIFLKSLLLNVSIGTAVPRVALFFTWNCW